MRVERLLWHARCAVVLLAVSGEARAHGAFPGIGTFYSGVLHPAVVPAHLLALLAIGLFAGRRGSDYIEQALLVVAGAGAAGLLLAFAGAGADIESGVQLVVLSISAVLGILVASDLKVPRVPGLLATAAVAFSIALDSAPESAGERVGALSGTLLGVLVLFLWFSGPVTLLTGPRQRIGLRIAGSWLSAISLLVLALAVRDCCLLAS